VSSVSITGNSGISMPYVQHTLALRRNVSASHRLPTDKVGIHL
jgi:hypothetical protein